MKNIKETFKKLKKSGKLRKISHYIIIFIIALFAIGSILVYNQKKLQDDISAMILPTTGLYSSEDNSIYVAIKYTGKIRPFAEVLIKTPKLVEPVILNASASDKKLFLDAGKGTILLEYLQETKQIKLNDTILDFQHKINE